MQLSRFLLGGSGFQDKDYPEEGDMPESDNAEKGDNLQRTSDCRATFHSPELRTDDGVHETCAVSEELKSSVEILNISNDSCEQDLSDHDSAPLVTDCGLKQYSSHAIIPHNLACEDTNAKECQCDEDNDSPSQLSPVEEFETTDTVKDVKGQLVKSFITCSNNHNVHSKLSTSTDSVENIDDINMSDVQISHKDKPGKNVFNSLKCCSTSGNLYGDNSEVKEESYESSNNNNVAGSIRQCLCSDSNVDCSKVIYSDCEYLSLSTDENIQAEDRYLSADTVVYDSELTSKPQSMGSYESSKVSKMCNDVIDSTFLKRVPETTHNIPTELNYSTEDGSKDGSYTHNQIKNGESEYNQLLEEYKVTDCNDYVQSVVTTKYKQVAGDSESCYKQMNENENAILTYKQSKKNLSSYKQHTSEDAEETDTEILDDDDDDDDDPCASASSNIYQSYEDSMTPLYQASALTEMVDPSEATHYGTSDGHTSAWSPAISSIDSGNNAASCNSQRANSQTYTTTQNTMTEAATSSAKGQTATSRCSPSSSSSSSRHSVPAYEDEHKAVLCTGDQTFKPAAARQPTMVPFMPSGCSIPYVSGINPSMYAGAAMVQGLGGPTVMTSSSVHIAQHPGGATIMQHQSMSTGLGGGLAQATVMQQQAMSSGVQAAAMMQHRTLSNGGQTMLVQQRTMTTGIGGLAQQTVVQQRLASQTGIAQAAMYHANAMRHRNLAAQQTSMMQQGSIRLFPARMMGRPLMQSQTLGNATLIRGGTANPAALIGHGLVRGGNNGAIMQHLVQQRYLGGPIMTGRGMQVMTGRPIRLVNK